MLMHTFHAVAAAHQGKMIFCEKVKATCLFSKNGGTGTYNDGKSWCKSEMSLHLILVWSDTICCLCTESFDDGIRMHLILLAFFFFLCRSTSLIFFFRMHLHDLLCLWIICIWASRYVCWHRQTNKAPCALCLVWCIVQWTSTLAKMTFWYFERQRKTAQIPYDFRYRKMQVSECLLISRAVFQIESLTSHLFLHCNVCKLRI